MIPVPGLDQVKVVWLRLEKEGVTLFGFLLYTNSDRVLVDYMCDGIYDLDYLSGEDCAIFVIESPSKEWINYTKRKNHSWWQLFGKEIDKQVSRKQEEMTIKISSLLAKNIIENNHNCTIVVGDENVMYLRDIIEPDSNLLYDRTEALKVAEHFGLNYDDVPCLIFFKNLDSRVIWKSPLNALTNQRDVTEFFRNFFGSPAFKSMLYENEGV